MQEKQKTQHKIRDYKVDAHYLNSFYMIISIVHLEPPNRIYKDSPDNTGILYILQIIK